MTDQHTERRTSGTEDDEFWTDAQTAPILPMILEWAEKLPKAEGWVWCERWAEPQHPHHTLGVFGPECLGPHYELRIARELPITGGDVDA